MNKPGISDTDESSPGLQRRLADFAMVLDLLGTLPGLMDEEKVIASIFNLFAMLCAPASITYVPIVGRQAGEPQCCPEKQRISPELNGFITDETVGHTLNSSGRGFLVRLTHGEETLGVFEMDGVAFPQYVSHYLYLAQTITQVCGLAIQNARTYQQLFATIAERERAEQEVLALNGELRRRIRQVEFANRELDAFAYAVSHDLRAPLRAMNGFSLALKEDFGESLTETGREYVDQIALASRNMGDLIEGLLKLSRTTRGDLRHDTVDLSAMALRILKGLAAAEPNRRVAWMVGPDLSACGDARMIEAALNNLLGNAWKYTANCKEAVIEFGELSAAEFKASVEPEYDARNSLPVFFIRDNGAGFDMKHAGKLFKPFQRLHRQDEFAGIGIGLATVQRIIRRHGGTVRAAAAPGKGAVFYFSLPSQNGRGGEAQAYDPFGER